jgi:molybdenum cofactor biosynthesis enzyme MoaA
MHRRTKSWFETAKLHNITNKRGKYSKGLAYQIAKNDYQPAHETLLRIGVQCDCEECKRVKRLAYRAAHQTLFDMSNEQIIEALKNRKPIKATHTKQAMKEFIRACKHGPQRVSAS